MKFAMMTFAAAVGGVNAAEIADPTAWKLGRCYVPDGETLGPQMKDNVDLFGLDWIKYWSANAEHNNGDLDSPKTTSAAACCEACESTPDCNMWTWTKSQQGCYLKSASKQTTYVERFDEGRVSGGWEASVHVDTNTFYGDQKTSTTTQLAAFNTNGVMVNHESTGELHTAATAKGAVDHDVDHLHRRLDAANHLLGVDYPSEDYVKFSNGRPEASTPTSCEEACTAYEKCEYWSWSHNDYHASCYLKSNLAMADKSYGYGYPVRTVVRMLTALSAAQPPSSHHRTPIASSSSPSLTTDPLLWSRVGLHARRRRRRWQVAAAARSGDHPSQELRVRRRDQAARAPEPSAVLHDRLRHHGGVPSRAHGRHDVLTPGLPQTVLHRRGD